MRRAGPLLSPALLRQFLEPWGDVRHHILRGLMEKRKCIFKKRIVAD